ncbi:oligosaccharide flippase family protein [Terrimonas alba]|uniref:oligosaccharide flippase family protein n=1 Tax=Terrimonas alba TaxID=3349636 RepID=UPI0035F4F7B2
MSRKFFRDISASTLQVLINQLLGLAVFFVLSIYLSKDHYGELNWSLSVFMFANTLLSLRLEQIIVKRSATEKDSSTIMSLFLVHVLLSGIGFYLLLLVLKFISPSFFTIHGFLLVIGISQLLGFIASPFKQVANGKERFDYLAIMSSVGNLTRVVLLTIAILFFTITIEWVLIIFIISSLVELLACFFLARFRMNIPISVNIRFTDYKNLLKESLPQIKAAFLMAGITRIDWILLGLVSTSAVVAEYSFAYRAYELSPFPLLIIAPVLLSRFSKFFAGNNDESLFFKKRELGQLIRAEMILATLIPLVLNIIWTPFVDFLTGNKYGAVNQITFLILSFCIPFQYISNIIWSAHFAQSRLKLILKITFITFCIVLIGDLVFIPLFNAKGAALVYLVAMITEYINYMRSSPLSKTRESWQSLIICLLAATLGGFGAFFLFQSTAWRLAFATCLFFLLLLATRQLRSTDLLYVIQTVKKNKSQPVSLTTT